VFTIIPPLVPILNHVTPAHTLTSFIFKIHFNIIFSSMSRSFALSLQVFRRKFCTQLLSVPLRATFFAHLPLLYLITVIVFGEEEKY
jgi:hypothetical protein